MQESKEGKEGDVQVGSQRIIKKYPNRRLYDTATSTYITLSQVKQLVMERRLHSEQVWPHWVFRAGL